MLNLFQHPTSLTARCVAESRAACMVVTCRGYTYQQTTCL